MERIFLVMRIESYKLLSLGGLIIFDDISNYNKNITIHQYKVSKIL